MYSILIFRWVPAESDVSFFDVLGFMGLLIMITFWPLIILFNYTGVEVFEFPES
jgi:hypothetical protein